MWAIKKGFTKMICGNLLGSLVNVWKWLSVFIVWNQTLASNWKAIYKESSTPKIALSAKHYLPCCLFTGVFFLLYSESTLKKYYKSCLWTLAVVVTVAFFLTWSESIQKIYIKKYFNSL